MGHRPDLALRRAKYQRWLTTKTVNRRPGLMTRSQLLTGFVAMAACAAVILSAAFSATPTVHAGQAPYPASAQDIPITNHDRVYAAEQYSNTVSVTDPSTNTLLGEIALGEPAPGYFSPLYNGQVLVHGLGFSPDNKTLVVVSIGSNAATFIDTATNTIKHTTYVCRTVTPRGILHTRRQRGLGD